jgi:hypothetical protein
MPVADAFLKISRGIAFASSHCRQGRWGDSDVAGFKK